MASYVVLGCESPSQRKIHTWNHLQIGLLGTLDPLPNSASMTASDSSVCPAASQIQGSNERGAILTIHYAYTYDRVNHFSKKTFWSMVNGLLPESGDSVVVSGSTRRAGLLQ